MNWYSEHFRKIHLLGCWPYWADRSGEAFDARKWVEMIKTAGIETIEMFAKDDYGKCWFKCDRGIQARDILNEVLEYTQPAGIKVISWFNYDNDLIALALHPEWTLTMANGSAPHFGNFASGCINTGYREYTLAQIEQLVQYPIDGLWMEFQSVWDATRNSTKSCHCISCRRK
jgi:hypothetical protein